MEKKIELELDVSLIETMGSGRLVVLYAHMPEEDWPLAPVPKGKTRKIKVTVTEE